jgi:hypothetical protein
MSFALNSVPNLQNFKLFCISTKPEKHGSRPVYGLQRQLDFIARNTFIPVRRVLDILVIHGYIHIVQEYNAPVFADVWDQMGLDEQKKLHVSTTGVFGTVVCVDSSGTRTDYILVKRMGTV